MKLPFGKLFCKQASFIPGYQQQQIATGTGADDDFESICLSLQRSLPANYLQKFYPCEVLPWPGPARPARPLRLSSSCLKTGPPLIIGLTAISKTLFYIVQWSLKLRLFCNYIYLASQNSYSSSSEFKTERIHKQPIFSTVSCCMPILVTRPLYTLH